MERRKFGPQGWNHNYPFSTGDLTICASVLYNYLEANTKVIFFFTTIFIAKFYFIAIGEKNYFHTFNCSLDEIAVYIVSCLVLIFLFNCEKCSF